MLPQTVLCEDCGEQAAVRGYGRIEYDWESTQNAPAKLQLKTIRLTIDCPYCGVRVQEHAPARGLCQIKYERRLVSKAKR